DNEKEEHPASADSIPPSPALHVTARISFRPQPPTLSFTKEDAERFLAMPIPPPSPLTQLSSPLPQIPSPPLPASPLSSPYHYLLHHYALLRKKFKEDLFTYCIENGIFQDFQDASESSNDNTNVVNALQEPFVVKQDPAKVSIIPDPEPFNNQTVDELPQTLPNFDPTCYSEDGNSFTYDSTSNLVHDSPNDFNPPP
nr:hypothetical protein [Tanacetum cinerariifolium]